jgi:hypothetical protein
VIFECDYGVTEERECIETMRVISKMHSNLDSIGLQYNNIINLNKISFIPFPKLFLAMNRIHRKILKIRSRIAL